MSKEASHFRVIGVVVDHRYSVPLDLMDWRRGCKVYPVVGYKVLNLSTLKIDTVTNAEVKGHPIHKLLDGKEFKNLVVKDSKNSMDVEYIADCKGDNSYAITSYLPVYNMMNSMMFNLGGASCRFIYSDISLIDVYGSDRVAFVKKYTKDTATIPRPSFFGNETIHRNEIPRKLVNGLYSLGNSYGLDVVGKETVTVPMGCKEVYVYSLVGVKKLIVSRDVEYIEASKDCDGLINVSDIILPVNASKKLVSSLMIALAMSYLVRNETNSLVLQFLTDVSRLKGEWDKAYSMCYSKKHEKAMEILMNSIRIGTY